MFSKPGVDWVLARTGQKDFTETARALILSWTSRLKLKRDANWSRAPELDEETARKYCSGALIYLRCRSFPVLTMMLEAYFNESYDAALGVVYRPAFEDRLRAHFKQGGSYGDGSSWYALQNTVYAFGCRIILSKDPSIPFTQVQAQAWRFFENALAVHMDLLYMPTGLMAVQALAIMVRSSPSKP